MLDFSLGAVIPAIIAQPALGFIIVLSMGTLFMNGAHDAANAIATAVATRSIAPGRALLMAALCNFFGVSLASFISTAVAKTMVTMVNFSGDNQAALIALCAAMLAIIIWGGATWYFGIPSSQSHALIAGVTGAAIALQGGIDGINFSEWVKVIWGLLVAVLLGFFLGWALSKLTGAFFRTIDKRKTEKTFSRLLNFTAGVLAFEHGMQDGQKFMGVCFLAIALAMGADQSVDLEFPLWLMIMCSLCMLIGTAVGGTNIIKNVGLNIVKMEQWQGLMASLSAAICIGISNMTGLPISTTHANTTAIMGVGTAKGSKAVNWAASTNMGKAWIYTFPGCGLMGFVFAKVFIMLF